MGLATPELLEALSGSLVSAFQLRRRLLSILQRVYSEARGRAPREVWRMSDIDCRAPGAPLLVASDASQHAEAAVAASVPEPFSRELTTPSRRACGCGSCPLSEL